MQMEEIGSLRQSSTQRAGKSYWMAFSNSGTLLKRGDRVDIVIGISTRPDYWSKSILG